MPRTKIVATIGPACQSPAQLESLIRAGMNVARLNFSHGTPAAHGEVIGTIRRLAEELGRPVAILQDLAGFKIRIGTIAADTITLEPGSLFTLTTRTVVGDAREVSISYPELPRIVQPGDTLLLSDGALELEVQDQTDQDIRCRVVVGGSLSSHKGLNVPARQIEAPALTEKDRSDLAFGIAQGVDCVALSFVRAAADVLEAKRMVQQHGRAIPLIAKIERHEALQNIDQIVAAVDGIMVARGDLGVEIPLQRVPLVQKMLIDKANRAGKPVITATHMLRSMVSNRRPTRAEVTDVANAVLDGTDAVMLSEETAVGQYPTEAVQMMAQIAEDAESGFPFDAWLQRLGGAPVQSLGEAVARAACQLAEDIDAACIVSCTRSGSTAQLVAKHRPRHPILAPTPDPTTYRWLALIWGVVPLQSESMETTDQMIDGAMKAVSRSGLVPKGGKLVITAGIPAAAPGGTSLIRVAELG